MIVGFFVKQITTHEGSKAYMVSSGNTVITITTGTCSKAAGADETLKALVSEIKAQDLTSVTLRQVGCNGQCEKEPYVWVKLPGRELVAYGNVDAATARRIISSHVVDGKPVMDKVVS